MASGFWRIGGPWWCWGRQSDTGHLLPGKCVWAAAALLLPLSDSLKISQLILSSCVTSCSAQAAINYLKILCFIW